MSMSDERFTRRGLLGRALAFTPIAVGGLGGAACKQPEEPAPGASLDRPSLDALARVLLPGELPEAERAAAVDDFERWLREYHPDAEMDHGYGFTRLRYTAPDPMPQYVADMDAMRTVARERHGAELAALDPEPLREIAAEAIEAAAPETDEIPGRPQAPHLCIALLAAYFGSSQASDRAYEAKIQREICRGLFIDVDEIAPLEAPSREVEA
jgi:hypothetical protein